MNPRVIAVVGPTATGKSDLAVQLAVRLGGEVVNADAMQLYRGMDVGTAKLPVAALATLDVEEGRRLLAAGVPAWRAVGGVLAGRSVTARLHHDAAPFGVGYLVASWVASWVAA